MTIKLVTGPAEEPLTLEEAKLHLRVDGSEEDTLISALIVAAHEHVENFINRQLITATYELYLDEFPGDCSIYKGLTPSTRNEITIPRSPIQSVAWIKYYDTTGTEQTWGTGNYHVDIESEPGRIWLAENAEYPVTQESRPNTVWMRFVAGYGDAEDVPQAIKAAMLLMIGDWYENRQDGVRKFPVASTNLLRPYRMIPQ